MRQALAIALVATIAFVAILFVLPGDRDRSQDLLRDEEGGAAGRSGRNRVIDLSSARGEHVFTPQYAEAEIDGRRVPYQAFLLWCAELAPTPDHQFRFRDVRILMNARPTTAAELSALVHIPPERPPERVGDEITAALGSRASGATAAEAVFHGGRDFASAERAELRGGVTIHVFDANRPEQSGRLQTDTLTLELSEGRVVAARTSGAVSFESRAASIRGVGLEIDLVSRRVRLDREITGSLDPSLAGLRGETALAFQAAGPLEFVAAGDAGADARLRGEGTFQVQGGISLRQGNLALSGESMVVQTGGEPLTVLRLVLEGPVVAETADGHFRGSRATFERLAESRCRLTLEGTPVEAIWRGAATILPGVSEDGDLQLTTAGTVVIDAVDAPRFRIETLSIGPDLTLLGPSIEVVAKSLHVRLAEVSKNQAEQADARETYPVAVTLDGGVRGRTPSGTFAGERFDYERSFEETGAPQTDLMTLSGFPEIAYVLTGAEEAADAGDLGLGSGTGSLVVRAQESITVRRDPMRRRPIEASARGTVVVQRLGPGGAADLRAQASAQELALRLVETWAPDLAGGGARLRPSRSLEELSASGSVSLLVPGRGNGEGETFEFHGKTGDAILKGTLGHPARVRVIDQRQQPQVVSAQELHFRSAARLLIALGTVHGELLLPALGYDLVPDSPPERTEAEAGQLRIWFTEVDEGGQLRRRIREARADGGIVGSPGTELEFAL